MRVYKRCPALQCLQRGKLLGACLHWVSLGEGCRRVGRTRASRHRTREDTQPQARDTSQRGGDLSLRSGSFPRNVYTWGRRREVARRPCPVIA